MRVVLAVLAVLSLAAPARAGGLYRCVRPDGTVLFSDQANACPDGSRHEPQNRLQVLPSPSGPASIAPGDDPAEPAVEQEQYWRELAATRRRELEEAERRAALLEEQYATCRRGAHVRIRPPDRPLWPAVVLPQQRDPEQEEQEADASCDESRRVFEEAQTEVEVLRLYLEEGLEDDCRRAECLPGWIRE
jgi:hypothetical protein